MTPAARLSAAIEVLADIQSRRRPASDALKDWGLAHRFAGSKDRAAIASLTYDALRRQASAAFIMGEETPRAILFGALMLQRGMDAEALGALCDGSRFAPAPLTDEERARLSSLIYPPRRIMSAPMRRTGSGHALRKPMANRPWRKSPRCPAARQSIFASTRSRPCVTSSDRSLRISTRSIPPGHPSACVLTLARAEGARRSRRCRNSSKGSLRFRMKAPSLSRRSVGCRARHAGD